VSGQVNNAIRYCQFVLILKQPYFFPLFRVKFCWYFFVFFHFGIDSNGLYGIFNVLAGSINEWYGEPLFDINFIGSVFSSFFGLLLLGSIGVFLGVGEDCKELQ